MVKPALLFRFFQKNFPFCPPSLAPRHKTIKPKPWYNYLSFWAIQILARGLLYGTSVADTPSVDSPPGASMITSLARAFCSSARRISSLLGKALG